MKITDLVLEYKVYTADDIVDMEKDLRLHMHPSATAASELGQNAVIHGEGATVQVNGKYVRCISEYALRNSISRIRTAIKKATSGLSTGNSYGGMGFTMLASAGWNLRADVEDGKLVVEATK